MAVEMDSRDRDYFQAIKDDLVSDKRTKKSKEKAEQDAKNIKEYILKMYARVKEYEDDIESGKIKSSKWIKLAVKREKKLREKYDYRKHKVWDVFKFTYFIIINTKQGRKRFEPLPWQAWAFDCVYGLYRSKDSVKRLRRYATIWVGRKSGKTSLAAIMALFAMMKEEDDAEVYFTANTKDQASQALKYLKQMVKKSPALRKRVEPLTYYLRYRSKEKGECIAKPLANEPEKLDGLSPSFGIIDECHAMATKELFNIIKTGTLARVNPLIVQISTAGTHQEYPFYNDLQIAKRVLESEIEDDSTFYALYTLDEGDDFEDVEVWIKSNPSLGATTELDDLINDWKKAKLFSVDMREFIIKNLNVYQDSEDTWIPDNEYAKCDREVDIASLKGCKGYIGLDLSSVRDLASMVVIVENPDTGKIEVIPEFYFPSKVEDGKKLRAGGIDLTGWIDAGYITEHKGRDEFSGRIIDHDKIFDRIVYWSEFLDIQAFGYDPYESSGIINRVDSELGLDLYPCKQNAGFFNAPLKLIERLIFSNGINMSGNPVLRWNFKNVVLYKDGNANIKIAKNKNNDSVDGAVALGMAVGMWMELNFDFVQELMDRYIQDKKKVDEHI